MSRKTIKHVSLTEREARERLAIAEKDPDVIAEIYDFGKMLVTEAVARVGKIDSKATYVAAYSVGIITLLVSTSAGWAVRIHFVWLPISAGFVALLSAVFAVVGLRLRSFEWFSNNDLLRSECLQDQIKLKQYRVLSMLAVVDSWESVARRKAGWITSAQLCLLVAALLLVVSLADALRSL